jgi:ABC-2 type transport system permease protein
VAEHGVGPVRAFLLLAGMWVRSTMAYRTSFAALIVAQFLVTGLDFVAVLLMFSRVDMLGGFGLADVAFLYGVSSIGLGLADLVIGNVDRVGRRVRDGSLDAMLVRPVPAIVQVAADEFAIRRVGRVLQSAVVLIWALAALEVTWRWDRILLVPVMILSGAVIFAAIFVVGAAFQFAAQDAAEVANAFTYGGNFLTQYPLTIFPKELVRAVTFIVPIAFVNWYPALYVLGREDPLGLPEAVQFAPPIVAAAMCGMAALAWRAGLRHYRSTGS